MTFARRRACSHRQARSSFPNPPCVPKTAVTCEDFSKHALAQRTNRDLARYEKQAHLQGYSFSVPQNMGLDDRNTQAGELAKRNQMRSEYQMILIYTQLCLLCYDGRFSRPVFSWCFAKRAYFSEFAHGFSS